MKSEQEHISAELYKRLSDAYFYLPNTARAMPWSTFREKAGLSYDGRDSEKMMHQQLSITDNKKFLLAKLKYGF